jgi:hypothetical protein
VIESAKLQRALAILNNPPATVSWWYRILGWVREFFDFKTRRQRRQLVKQAQQFRQSKKFIQLTAEAHIPNRVTMRVAERFRCKAL